MATPISSVVNITLSISSIQLTGPGFGLPLVLSPDTVKADVISSYASLASAISDGYAPGMPAYAALSAIFSQSPCPPVVLVGRRTHLPTMSWTFTPTATLRPGGKYGITIDGTDYTFVASSTPTATSIVSGLTAAIGSPTGLTLSGSTALHIVANTAGSWHDIRTDSAQLLDAVQDNADGGIALDLAAIQLARNDWYCLVSCFQSKAEIIAAAAWTEANKKLYIASTQDSAVVNTVAAGATDVAATLQTSAYSRTGLLYSGAADAFPDGAWAGRVLPLTAGSESWNFKTLAGVPADNLTDTEVANATSKNANVYVNIAGQNFTFGGGKVPSGQFIDITRGSDAYVSDLQIAITTALASGNKLPMDDSGIAAVEASIKGVNKRYEQIGFFVKGSSAVVVPLASTISSSDRQARRLTGVSTSAQLAGSINSAYISVTITP